MATELRERKIASTETDSTVTVPDDDHRKLGKPKHGLPMEALRVVAFTIYFLTCIASMHAAQFLGLPLYLYNKPLYAAWVALIKSHFGIHITTMTYWWSPTLVRVSGDKSVAGLIHRDARGLVRLDFGERVLLMANHQLYTDWLYLWWAAYTNAPGMHGHIYIILKETLKWVPIVGPAMQFFNFIFMARSWDKDQDRLRKALRRLGAQRTAASSSVATASSLSAAATSSKDLTLDPMWLLIFPEGTNLSANERRKSAEFCAKSGKQDLRHQVLPRPAGLHLLLTELRDTVPYLYDCTIGYASIPPGHYGAEIYGLRTVYIQGRPPQSVNMHWRRFATKDIPVGTKAELQAWLEERYREKDELLEVFYQTGKFPAEAGIVAHDAGSPRALAGDRPKRIETQVRPRSQLEFVQMFMPVATAAVVGRVIWQIGSRFFGGR